MYEDARKAVRDFIGAKSVREIIFTRNTTESINLVAYSYGLSHVKAGDEILVSIMEHHSNLLPWQMVARTTGAVLRFMECRQDGSLIWTRYGADYGENQNCCHYAGIECAWQSESGEGNCSDGA